MKRSAAAGLLLLLVTAVTAPAYDFITTRPIKWHPGDIPMELQLDETMASRVLLDGKTSWNAVAEEALGIWNAELSPVQFTTSTDSTHRDGNGRNEVFFSSNVYGRRFGVFVLAITTTWHIGTERVEGDTIFNTDIDWDSYRGQLQFGSLDLRRVAIHEFGHTLGLDHPDQARQVNSAIMNSRVSDLDTLAEDDIRGAHVLYPPKARYALNISVEPPGSGDVLVTPAPADDGMYAANQVVTLTAKPHLRNRFTFWGRDDSRTGRRLKVPVADDETITANFTTNGAPQVTQQPRSQFASSDESAIFQVRALSASPASYQWQFNGSDLPGANNPELLLDSLGHADSGLYSCRITNARGATFSRPARLVVDGY
jgi:hypothetical protein